jgi:colanic acid/amylovoran biosynthesis glycosyltransferase
MKQRGVAHFIRISSQLNLSFILNQITSHLDYSPVVIIYKKQKSTKSIAQELLSERKIPVLFLCDENDLFNRIYYFIFRKITLFQKRKINKFVRANQCNLFHFHFGNDAGMFLPVIHHSGFPSIVSFYGDDCTGFPKKYFGLGHAWLRFRVFSKADRVLAMSQDMKKDLVTLGCPKEKITVHYFGADTKRFQGYARTYASSDEVARLLIIANLVEKKGHMFLFEGLKLLLQKGVPFHLRVIGSGPLDTRLRAFAEENGLSDHISFIPHVDYLSEEFVRLYYDSDIFIHPSVTGSHGEKEGIPGVIVEAMSTGLPVIATVHAGIPSIIENGKTGLLVAEWKVDELVQALHSLITDPSKREALGRAAQKFAADDLNIAGKEKELESIYSGLSA